jgi:hypothetical protein
MRFGWSFAAFSLMSAMPAFAEQAHNWMPLAPAPGPILGAGLPVLAIGYGAYRLIKWHRQRM